MAVLDKITVAILVTDGFEQVELTRPQRALDLESADTRIVSPKPDHVRAWNFTDWGEEFPVDVPLARARAEDFDALLLPGGVMNPDTLRMQPAAVAFVKAKSVGADRTAPPSCADASPDRMPCPASASALLTGVAALPELWK